MSEAVALPKLSLAPRSACAPSLPVEVVGDLTPLPMVVVASYCLVIVDVIWLNAGLLPWLTPALCSEVDIEELEADVSIWAGKIVTATF